MSDLLAEMEADFEEASATAVEKVNQEGLGSVAEIARAIRVKEDQIAALEDQLKESKKRAAEAHGRRLAGNAARAWPKQV